MEPTDWEVKTLTATERVHARKRSNRLNMLRKNMEKLEYAQYCVIPEDLFSHAAARQGVHLIAKELNKGRFRCMRDKESGEVRVVYLGD